MTLLGLGRGLRLLRASGGADSTTSRHTPPRLARWCRVVTHYRLTQAAALVSLLLTCFLIEALNAQPSAAQTRPPVSAPPADPPHPPVVIQPGSTNADETFGLSNSHLVARRLPDEPSSPGIYATAVPRLVQSATPSLGSGNDTLVANAGILVIEFVVLTLAAALAFADINYIISKEGDQIFVSDRDIAKVQRIVRDWAEQAAKGISSIADAIFEQAMKYILPTSTTPSAPPSTGRSDEPGQPPPFPPFGPFWHQPSKPDTDRIGIVMANFAKLNTATQAVIRTVHQFSGHVSREAKPVARAQSLQAQLRERRVQVETFLQGLWVLDHVTAKDARIQTLLQRADNLLATLEELATFLDSVKPDSVVIARVQANFQELLAADRQVFQIGWSLLAGIGKGDDPLATAQRLLAALETRRTQILFFEKGLNTLRQDWPTWRDRRMQAIGETMATELEQLEKLKKLLEHYQPPETVSTKLPGTMSTGSEPTDFGPQEQTTIIGPDGKPVPIISVPDKQRRDANSPVIGLPAVPEPPATQPQSDPPTATASDEGTNSDPALPRVEVTDYDPDKHEQLLNEFIREARLMHGNASQSSQLPIWAQAQVEGIIRMRVAIAYGRIIAVAVHTHKNRSDGRYNLNVLESIAKPGGRVLVIDAGHFAKAAGKVLSLSPTTISRSYYEQIFQNWVLDPATKALLFFDIPVLRQRKVQD